MGLLGVPNVPCGVESTESQANSGRTLRSKFLMYRVELKVLQGKKLYIVMDEVPNVPCGVESFLQ